MAEQDPLSDLFTMFAAPIAGTIRSVEQFRTGVDEFLKGVENFNRTMANLNETTERINALLEEVEEPIRIAVPQFTRSMKAADEMTQAISGPAMAAAPALTQIADTLATPAFQQLPARVAQFNEIIGDISRRIGPLSQLAESAGGLGALLGGFRFPGSGPRTELDAVDDAPDAAVDVEVVKEPEPEVTVGEESESEADEPAVKDVEPEAEPAPEEQPPAKKSATKKKSAVKKKSPAKKRPAKKPAAKKKSPAEKKSAPKKKSPAESSAKPSKPGPTADSWT